MKKTEHKGNVPFPELNNMRYSRAYQAIKKFLEQTGMESPSAEARMMLEHLGLDLKTLLLFDGIFSQAQAKELHTMLQRRLSREPLQYILGQVSFLDCKIRVNPNVLIPRPETEELTEIVAALTMEKDVLDLCCGSGCIGIALAKKGARSVTALDISTGALKVAQENASLNKVVLRLIKSDMFEDVGRKKFHVIVSNPPYIPQKELPYLQKEVRDHEPAAALDGGEDGLDFYRTIAAQAQGFLHPGGKVCLELGDNQAERVQGFFETERRYKVELQKDLRGVIRFLFATLL